MSKTGRFDEGALRQSLSREQNLFSGNSRSGTRYRQDVSNPENSFRVLAQLLFSV
ncbi:MAG TPA: hypothetical protein VK579_02550 [Terriglobales bacterium]|jgi:hypothetical protein|nr:hypothetical protein [Terriglobales bacterium]